MDGRLKRLALVALVLAGCSEAERPPDVILLSLDSVRADSLTFRDPEVTPFLERFARKGTVFTRAVSGSSWTLPAHVQMFTGQPPQLHGVHNDERNIDSRTPTLSECLADQGYATLGFWSGWFLSGQYGFERGFDVYRGALEVEGPGADEEGDERAAFVKREHSSHRQITSERLLGMMREALAEVPASEPLFLFGHFFDPHYDYIPPPPYDTKLDPDYTGDIDGRDFWANKRIFDPEKRPARQIGDRDLEHVRALYGGEIAWTDSVLGELLDELAASGRLENAIVIVTSDHGEEFFEHDNRGHRQGLYEEVLRVPLLVARTGSAPEASPVAAVDALVSLSDVMPTLLEAAGAPVPSSVFGRSLLPFLDGTAPSGDRERFVVSTLTAPDPSGDATLWMDSLHSGSAKLIRQLRLPVGGAPEVRSVHWFDLEKDPGERRPRADSTRPEIAGAWRRLESELQRMRELHDRLPHAPPGERVTDVRTIFASELDALGYAGSDGEPPAHAGQPATLKPLPPVDLP